VLQQAVEDFKSRHYCQSRGNNIRALKWLGPSTVLVFAEVYPDTDCGKDLGYVEGYTLDVRTASMRRKRISLPELKRLKGVCLQNAEWFWK